jgi:hypothetical protein
MKAPPTAFSIALVLMFIMPPALGAMVPHAAPEGDGGLHSLTSDGAPVMSGPADVPAGEGATAATKHGPASSPASDITPAAAERADRPSVRAATPGAGEGSAGERLVVISNSTNVTLALGSWSMGMHEFPDPHTGFGTLQNGVAVDITGQLVDGNYTEIGIGGQGAASKNHGIANITQSLHWSFNGVEQTPLSLSWKNPADPNNTQINGTVFITSWAPDVPVAGFYPMLFWFEGADVNIGGTNFNIYPPCR